LLIMISFGVEGLSFVLNDPGVPDGEQFVWRVTKEDEETGYSTITWHTRDRNGRPVYEIILDSGEQKQAKYVVNKCDLRLVWSHIVRITEDGRSEVTIEVKDKHQYLTFDLGKKCKDKKIDNHPDGYNGMVLAFCLRGFPFGRQKEVKIRLTPPFKPKTPFWVWKMWKSYARFLGEERVTVPAGTFDCYKLEVAASGGLIKRFSSEYYFWYTKEPPHRFVKYQDKDGKSVTELMEMKSMGTE